MRFNRALLVLPLLTACATPSDEYPSLAIRDAERVTGTLEPAAPEPYTPPATPPAVIDRLEALAADAANAHRTFLAEVPATRRLVAAARGAEMGSDGWARASVAVAGLEGARSRAMISLADVDRLMVDAAIEGGALERIVAVRDTVTAQVEEQNATIESLLGALR